MGMERRINSKKKYEVPGCLNFQFALTPRASSKNTAWHVLRFAHFKAPLLIPYFWGGEFGEWVESDRINETVTLAKLVTRTYSVPSDCTYYSGS